MRFEENEDGALASAVFFAGRVQQQPIGSLES